MKAEAGKKSGKTAAKQVRFSLEAAPGSQVSVAGTFNNWDPMANPMQDNPKSGVYRTALRIPPGRYEYKFVVNGEWRTDPNCPAGVSNEFGDMNSVLTV